MEEKEMPGGDTRQEETIPQSNTFQFNRQDILNAIQGRRGEVRIDCQCPGSQKQTLSINADSGLYHCHRCGLKGRAKDDSGKKPLADYIWDSASDCLTYPYLELKQVKSYGLRIDNRYQLLIPFYAYGQLSTLQTIDTTGAKKFLPKAKGCYAKAASFIIQSYDDTVYICEGYATAATIREITGSTCIVVGMKSNFVASFEKLKEQFNDSDVIFCADNDQDGGGLKACLRAAKKFNAKVVMPEQVGQDFNDLFLELGKDAVVKQLNNFIDVTQAKIDFKDYATTDAMQETDIDHIDVINAAYDGQKGGANLYIKTFAGTFCHDRAAGLWYEFKKHFWELDLIGKSIRECDVIQEFFKQARAGIDSGIMETALKTKQTVDENESQELQAKEKKLQADRKAVNSIIQYLNNLYFRKNMIEFAANGVDSLGITGDEWDLNPWELAVQNGIVDLKTGELKSGKPGDYIKSACPTIYNPDATCPAFEKFIIEIMDNDLEAVDFLRLILGAGLIGESTFKQWIVILSGQGRNGKDTLMGIIQHVLGLDLAAPIPSEMLLNSGPNGKRNSSGPSADLMKLRGLRLAYANETSQGRSFNVGEAKKLSGGGKMTARAPFGRRNVDWEQTHLLILMTNSKPNAPIDDYAFWKRIKTIHFPLSFIAEPKHKHERKVDLNLSEKLKKESSGILNFLISGCLDYQKFGLIEPAAVKAANLQYLKDVDIIGIFIEECCLIKINAMVTSKELNKNYRIWAQENGHRPVSGDAFSKYISKRFENEHTRRGAVYHGLGLILGAEFEAETDIF